MARTLSFDTYRTSEELEPIEISIGPGDEKETFLFEPVIGGIEMMDLLGELEGDDTSAASRAVKKFLSFAATDEDRDRFMEYLTDKKNLIDPKLLMDIAYGLVEEYMGGVPTGQEQSSSNGSAPNGSGPKRKPSSKARTSTR